MGMFKIQRNTDADELSENDFFAHFADEVETFEAPAKEVEPETGKPQDYAETSDNYFEPANTDFADLNQDMSGFMVETFDGLAAWLIAYFVAKNAESENYRLPHREIEKIKLLVGKMVPSNKPLMPNWMALLITIGGAYTPIVAGAMNDRKIQEQQEEIERLKAEIEKSKNTN